MLKHLRPISVSFLFSLTMLTACGKPSPSYSLLPSGQSFKQTNGFNNQLDILFVIDNSPSMANNQANLANNFNSFIQNFQNLGYDFKIAVTTTDTYYADSNLNGYKSSNSSMAQFRDGSGTSHSGVFVITPQTPNLVNTFITNATQGTAGSHDERSFQSMRTALQSNLNTGFLRPSSFLVVVMLGDEDDFSSDQRVADSFMLAKTDPNYVSDHNYSYANLDAVSVYESFLDNLTKSANPTRRYNVNGIVIPDSACATQDGNAIDQRYMQLFNDTNGITGSICDASFSNSLNAIQQHVAELSTQFFLDQIPQVNTIVVAVNGVVVPQDPSNGWTYNSAANSIVFHGSAIPAQGASIRVDFTPAGIHN